MEERAMGRPGIRRRIDAPGEGEISNTQTFHRFPLEWKSSHISILFSILLKQGVASEEVWGKGAVLGIEVENLYN